MVTPGKLLIALAAIALIGVASYVASTLFLRHWITQASEPNLRRPDSHPATTEHGSDRTSKPSSSATAPWFCVCPTANSCFRIAAPAPVAFRSCNRSQKARSYGYRPQASYRWRTSRRQNPDCAISRAKWDPNTEQASSTGRKIRKIPPGAVAQQLNKVYPAKRTCCRKTYRRFGFDLDNDGKEEIIYIADNITRLADLHEKTKQVLSDISCKVEFFRGRSPDFPSPFFHEDRRVSRRDRCDRACHAQGDRPACCQLRASLRSSRKPVAAIAWRSEPRLAQRQACAAT